MCGNAYEITTALRQAMNMHYVLKESLENPSTGGTKKRNNKDKRHNLQPMAFDLIP